eukprot:COSAG01_NODE_1186_length_11341_cov_3.330635_14_plen_70_part_00
MPIIQELAVAHHRRLVSTPLVRSWQSLVPVAPNQRCWCPRRLDVVAGCGRAGGRACTGGAAQLGQVPRR